MDKSLRRRAPCYSIDWPVHFTSAYFWDPVMDSAHRRRKDVLGFRPLELVPAAFFCACACFKGQKMIQYYD